MTTNLNKQISTNHTIIMQHTREEDGDYFFATIQERDSSQDCKEVFHDDIRGCYWTVIEALGEWIDSKIDVSRSTPYKGKLAVRLPKDFSAKIYLAADRSCVELLRDPRNSERKRGGGYSLNVKYSLYIGPRFSY
jgi:hypothetical protein